MHSTSIQRRFSLEIRVAEGKCSENRIKYKQFSEKTNLNNEGGFICMSTNTNQSEQVWGVSVDWRGTNRGLCKRSAGRCVRGSERLNEAQTQSLMWNSSRCRNQTHTECPANVMQPKTISCHLHFSADVLHICVYIFTAAKAPFKACYTLLSINPWEYKPPPPPTRKKKGVKKQRGAPAVKLMAGEWH